MDSLWDIFVIDLRRGHRGEQEEKKITQLVGLVDARSQLMKSLFIKHLLADDI